MLSPDGRLLADLHDALPCKRPLYLGEHPDVIHRAIAYDLPSAWFGKHVASGEAFIRHLVEAHHAACMQLLSMSHKSGALVLGGEAVLRAADAGALTAVIAAEDASVSEARRLSSALPQRVTLLHWGERQMLGQPFGRASQVFIGIRPSGLSDKLTAFLRRDTGFRALLAL